MVVLFIRVPQGLRAVFPLPCQRSQAAREMDTCELPQRPAILPPPPHANASTAEKIKFLHQQLDSLGADAEILPDLCFLGGTGNERIQGGVLEYL
jgi:hypothetical protein